MPEDILYSSGSNIGTFSDNAGPGAPSGYTGGSPVDTGDLRRKYDFSDRVSELAVSQDPFFRLVSKLAKKPTDDPQFKFTERRGSMHKRYAYLVKHGSSFNTAITANADSQDAVGDTWYGKFGTDYLAAGNKTNVYGQTTKYQSGDDGTKPEFFLVDQLIKVPVAAADNSGHDKAVSDYQVIKVTNVADSGHFVHITGVVVKGVASGSFYMSEPAGLNTGETNIATLSEEALAPYKCYVVGSVFEKGTGYPETWKDQPFSTSYGQTQIFKTTMAMTNTDRATSLKYEGNEWARIWKEKLVEHKWDIEQSMLFGSQSATHRTTQGAVDWILANGNAFSWKLAKTADDFLNDMSALLDPRYGGRAGTVFFCSTEVYNWLHQLGGYFSKNVNINDQFRADLAIAGRKKVLGLDMSKIQTPYGDMNLVRNVHLDGTNVSIMGVDLKHCAYRPLVGNGLNRDTSIYVGVQTLENSGVDRRVDQILTEAGMEWSMPEAHAIWKRT